jgi:hypothetical protein
MEGIYEVAIEMGSGAMIPSFINIGSGNEKLMEGIHRDTESMMIS